MKSRGLKSFLATLLAFVLCLPLSPIVAFAESTQDDASYEALTIEPVDEYEEEAAQNDEEAPTQAEEDATSNDEEVVPEEEEAASTDEEAVPKEEVALEAPVALMAAPRRAPAADGDTDWQDDWTYTLDAGTGTITHKLHGFRGRACGSCQSSY